MSRMIFKSGSGQQEQTITVQSPDEPGGAFVVAVGDSEPLELDVRQVGPRAYHVLHGVDGHEFLIQGALPELKVHNQLGESPVRLLDERMVARMVATGAAGAQADGTTSITAPMPGKVVKCLVQEGDEVTAGQGIIVVEAMKMENELRCVVEGTVTRIAVEEGANVEAGELLVTIE